VITLKDIQANPTFKTLIRRTNEYLSMLGYTEHGLRHVTYVSTMTAYILETLGHDKRTVELGAIAGYLHDIGNMHNRKHHGPTGANIVYYELRRLGMPLEEICDITIAIANHEEEIGVPVTPITAALVIADKSDAHRTRVGRVPCVDIHDRVNHAITDTSLVVNRDDCSITLELAFDTGECQIMDYFTIYLTRMEMCQQAAALLGCTFRLIINGLELIGDSACAPELRPAAGEGCPIQ